MNLPVIIESVSLNAYLNSLVRAADVYRLASRGSLSHLLTGKNRLKERIKIMIDRNKNGSEGNSGNKRKALLTAVGGVVLCFAFFFVLTTKVTARENPANSEAGIAEVLELVSKGEMDQARLLLEQISIQDYLASLDIGQRLMVPAENPLEGHDYYVSMSYGKNIHPIYKEEFFHRGVDLAAERGSAIRSVCAGKVLDVGIFKPADSPENNDNLIKVKAYGTYVMLEHVDGFYSFYAHLDSVCVKEGQSVQSGQKIGTLGNTGLSTGPHLHYEIRLGVNGLSIDPALFIEFPGNGDPESIVTVTPQEKMNAALALVQTQKTEQAAKVFTNYIGEYLASLDKRELVPYQNPLLDHEYRILIGYGPAKDPVDGHDFFHKGLDLAAERGTPVYPVCEGKVVRTGMDDAHNYYLEIRHANDFSSFTGIWRM